MAIIGDQFDVGGEICGAVISIRHSEDILSLWNQSADDGRVNLRIRCVLAFLNMRMEQRFTGHANHDCLPCDWLLKMGASMDYLLGFN